MSTGLLFIAFCIMVRCLTVVVGCGFMVTRRFMMPGTRLGVAVPCLAAFAPDFFVEFTAVLRGRCLTTGPSGLAMLLRCASTFHKRSSLRLIYMPPRLSKAQTLHL
jgi:hypothetical protein